MKIRKSLPPTPMYRPLYTFPVGTVVRLKRRLNRNMDVDDPMLIVDMQSYSLYVNSSCRPDAEQMRDRVVLVNLAHARLSCVDCSREAIAIDAEVYTS